MGRRGATEGYMGRRVTPQALQGVVSGVMTVPGGAQVWGLAARLGVQGQVLPASCSVKMLDTFCRLPVTGTSGKMGRKREGRLSERS